MNEEIKEILDRLKDNTYVPLEDNREYKLLDKGDDIVLLDYITNLQEENERLTQELVNHLIIQNGVSNLKIDKNGNFEGIIETRESYKKKYEDYKSRNEKAIEYNYELQERYCHSALFDELVASKIYEITEKKLNILQGDDEE